MLKLALSQLKEQPRRYLSVLLAIIVGITFLASALLVGSSSTATLRNSLGSIYSASDLVAAPGGEDPYEAGVHLAEAAGTDADPGVLQQVDGVQDAYAHVVTGAGLQRPAESEGSGTWSETADFAQVTALPEDASLLPQAVVAGALPAAGSTAQIAVDEGTAEQYGLSVGDSTTVLAMSADGDSPLQVTVAAVLARSEDPLLASAVQIYGSDALLTSVDALSATAAAGDPVAESESPDTGDQASTAAAPSRFADYVLFSLQDGADLATTQAAVQSDLDQQGIAAEVRTPEAQAQAQVEELAGSNVFVWVLAAFAAIALLVTALVIANTFSVLVAQRSRELALQRALGASRGQVRGAVLAEAGIIGLVGSVIGIGLAAVIVAALIAVGRTLTGFEFLAFGMDPVQLLVCVGVGVVITVIASLSAARHATRVSPLEAMRPREDAAVGNRAGRVRLGIGALLLALGAAALIGGAFAGNLGIAVAGGAVSFVGVLMMAVLFVPAAVRVAGVVVKPAGVPGTMARLNAVRNPGRTAATAAALLIGTTLVAMMLTGGRTAQDQMDGLLGARYPVDLELQLTLSPDELADSSGSLVPDGADVAQARDRVAAVDGVQEAAALLPAGVMQVGTTVLAADPARLRAVVAGLPGEDLGRLGQPGTVLVPSLVEQDTLTVQGPTGARELAVVRSSSPDIAPVITLEDARSIGWDESLAASAASEDVPDGGAVPELPEAGAAAPRTAEPGASGEPVLSPLEIIQTQAPLLWMSATDGQTLDTLQDLTAQITEAAGTSQAYVGGALPERLLYSMVIDAMLMVVTALLAVSVLVALIGVANTLSLSTIERTRENSLMRALGLTRGGLRGMLALEAVLIAGVAALLGCVLGTLYGWMGSQSVLGPIAADYGRAVVWPTVPWLELAVIVLVAVVAGLLASVAPARRAARLSPVQGLAMA